MSIWQCWREMCTHYKCVMQHSYVPFKCFFFCIRKENLYTYTMGSCAILTGCLSLCYPLYFLVNCLSFYSPVYRKLVALSMYLYIGSSKIRGNRLLKNETCISFMVFCTFYFVYKTNYVVHECTEQHTQHFPCVHSSL